MKKPKCKKCNHTFERHKILRFPLPKPEVVKCTIDNCECKYRKPGRRAA